MAFIIKDRVKEGTTSTGTGAVSLGGSAATFDTFQSYMTNGDTTYYAIVHTTSGTDEWEVGLGTWNTGNTLTRTTVLAGSNGTSAVDFSAGTKDVFMTYPAAHAALAEDDVTFDNITVTGTVDGRDVAADGTKLDTVEQNADVTDTVNVAAAGALMKSGGTMTGNLILNADPTTALGAATKEYVDTIAAAGIHYHTPVRVEAPSALTATYDNGTSGVGATLTNSGTQAALVIDGVTLSTSDRVLVYNQTNAAHNGIYTVTNTGSASTNWVLTRATDADSYGVSDPDAFGEGDAFFVKEGDTGAGELYVMNTSGTITFGTTAITFTVIAETAVYSAGTGMSLSGTTFSIGQDVGTTDNVTFNQVTAAIIGNVTGNLTGDVTGNADTATALETARTIQLSGDVTGSATFDGSANINITAAVQDDSHAHVISNVDGLQAALDAKADDSTTITAGNGLTGGGSIGVNRTLNVGAGGGITVSADEVAHADTSSQASVNNSGNTFIQDVTLDTYGHITGLTSSTVTVGDATITVASGGGLTGSGDFTTNQGTNETITLSHADTSSQASVNNSGRTYIQDITLDGYGHITGITSATETVTNTNQLTTFQVEDGDGTEVTISQGKEWKFVEGGGVNIDWTDTTPGSDADPYDLTFTINTGVTAGSGLTGGGTLNVNRTISHADTSTQASVNNSNGTVIQDITLDGFGHITGLASVNLDGRYYTETEADSRFVNVTGDTMTGDLLVQDDIKSTGQVRATGWWNNNTGTSGNDLAVEMGISSGAGYILTYNRNTSTYGSLNFNATSFAFNQRPVFSGNTAFDDGYHPNADKWTTARTLSLSGDASGSVSWDGSANATLSVTVANNSHTHTPANIPNLIEGTSFSGEYPVVFYIGSTSRLFSESSITFRGSDSRLAIDGNTVWHAGNDGSGSGLDADTVDGVHGGSFLRSDADDTVNAGVTYTWSNTDTHGLQFTNSSYGTQLRIGGWSTSNDNNISRLRTSSGNFHIDSAANGNLYFNWYSGGSIQCGSSVYAPIVYDKDDSGYYINPNGTSRLKAIHVGDSIDVTPNATAFTNVLGANGTSNRSTYFDGGGAGSVSVWWGSGNSPYGAIDADQANGLRMWYNNSSGAWSEQFRVTNGFTHSLGSSRAPIFYDSNDTSYYTNPNSTSSMYQINIWNDVEFKNKGQGITGTYDSYALQGVFNMGDAYKLASDGSTAGNLYGIAWSHPNAGTKGGANNLASHGMLILENGSFKGAWGGGRLVTPSDIRGTLFYDYNNTAYYADPASNSRTNTEQTNYLGLGTASNTSGGYRLNMGGSIDMNNNSIDYVTQVHFNDNVRFFDDGNDSYLNYKWGDGGAGGIKFYDGNNTLHGYVYGDGGGRFGLLDNDGAWAVHIGLGTEPLQLRCNNNIEFYVYDSYTYSPGSSRAPIFYDHNNTNYYVDPASTSKFNSIYLEGAMYHNGDTNTYIQFHAADQWRVVTGGAERFEVNNSQITSTEPIHAPSFHGSGASLTGIVASARNGYFWENNQTITSNQTITNGKNAMSAGPITVNSGVTVTIGDGEAWTIV